MKRPFIFIGAAALTVSFASLLCNPLYIILTALLLAAALCCAYAVLGKRLSLRNTVIALLMLLLIAASSLLTLETRVKPTEKLDKSSVKMSAVLIEKPYFADSGALYTFYGYHTRLDRNIKFSLWSDSLELAVGDRINADITFSETEELYKASDLADGIYIAAAAENIISIEEDSSKLLGMISELRQYVKQTVSSGTRNDTAGILIALLTGDRDFISDELYAASKVCGATHVMVVSGLHIGILCSILLKIMERLKLKHRLAVFLSFVLTVFVIVICDFHTSAIRAALMSVITLSGSLINRKADSLNSLGFSVTVMILFSPFLAGNIAFLLSVAATFGVVFVSPLIFGIVKPKTNGGLFQRVLSAAYNIVVISLSALICTLPVSIRYFGYFSLISPISSLLITFAVSAVLLLSTATVVLSLIPVLRLLTRPLLFITSIFGNYIVAAVKFLGRYKSFVVTVSPELAPLCFLLSALFITAVWLLYKRKTLKGPEKDVS